MTQSRPEILTDGMECETKAINSPRFRTFTKANLEEFIAATKIGKEISASVVSCMFNFTNAAAAARVLSKRDDLEHTRKGYFRRIK
jgi:hypothetical protein